MRLEGVDTYDMLGDGYSLDERDVGRAIYGEHRYHFTALEMATIRRAMAATIRLPADQRVGEGDVGIE